jgi:hypothetical protein
LGSTRTMSANSSGVIPARLSAFLRFVSAISPP